MYKWLPIIFGCHCKKERSFHYNGKQFPICARCTGELAGIIIGIVTWYAYQVSLTISLLLMVPMVADGFVQLLTSYESNNRRRFMTGLLFGYGLLAFFVITTVMTFQF
ncbi:MAG: DUF2085 domain-containing protein, partial [Clostridia bacterium]|nr:DUF2085 domain-containing protein [Clostridia bacterium]